jgi:hypoxanthine phosphoribosyltransferase
VQNLRARGLRSLKIVALLNKPARREIEVPVDYVGFDIPDEFVVGYGLDYDQRYRNLSDICILRVDQNI